jgi:platelet-activating factor acetylhydrolase
MLERIPTVPSGEKPDDVPRKTKKPKARPPNHFREKIIRNPLPYYSGPYSIGMMDIEVPVREPRHFSDIKRDHRYLLELETVLMSVWYPSGRFVFSQLPFN